MNKRHSQQGFSAVEGLLLLIFIAGIGAAGWWVSSHRTEHNDSGNSVTVSNKDNLSAKAGTISGVEAISSSDADDEAAIEQNMESSQSSSALQEQSSTSAIGDSINENSL